MINTRPDEIRNSGSGSTSPPEQYAPAAHAVHGSPEKPGTHVQSAAEEALREGERERGRGLVCVCVRVTERGREKVMG